MAYNLNATYRYFISPCPALGCNNKEVIKWKHPPCGTWRQINQHGYLYCSTCKSEIFILDEKFKCQNHNDSRSANSMKICSDLSAVADLLVGNDRAWYRSLTQNIMRRYEERDDN